MKLAPATLAILFSAVTLAGAGDAPKPSLPRLENGKYGYQETVEVDGASAAELYARAKAWVAKAYDWDVVTVDDPTSGNLVAKAEFFVEVPFYGTKRYPHGWVIELKDGRYRYTLSDFEFVGSVGAYGSAAYSELLEDTAHRKTVDQRFPKVAIQADKRIALLKAMMQQPAAPKSNW